MLVLEFNFDLTDLRITFFDWDSWRLSALSSLAFFLLFTAFLGCLLEPFLADVNVNVEILLVRIIWVPNRRWPLLSLIWNLRAHFHLWILFHVFGASWLETVRRRMHQRFLLLSPGWALPAVFVRSRWPALTLAWATSAPLLWSWPAFCPWIWVFYRYWCWLFPWEYGFPVCIESERELLSRKSYFFLCNA